MRKARERVVRTIALAACALFFGACAFGEFRPHDPFGHELNLEETQLEYTALVRWSQFGKASAYVHTDDRNDYLAKVPSKKLRFTDFEVNPWDLDEELGKATIEVVYTAYDVTSPYEYEISETQEWEREGRAWSVRPSFGELSSK